MEETVKERDRKEKKLDGYWAEMKRCLRLLKVFAKVSLMSQLEYRANFVAGVAVETGWMLIKLLYAVSYTHLFRFPTEKPLPKFFAK